MYYRIFCKVSFNLVGLHCTIKTPTRSEKDLAGEANYSFAKKKSIGMGFSQNLWQVLLNPLHFYNLSSR
jgi:hypothetical protein